MKEKQEKRAEKPQIKKIITESEIYYWTNRKIIISKRILSKSYIVKVRHNTRKESTLIDKDFNTYEEAEEYAIQYLEETMKF